MAGVQTDCESSVTAAQFMELVGASRYPSGAPRKSPRRIVLLLLFLAAALTIKMFHDSKRLQAYSPATQTSSTTLQIFDPARARGAPLPDHAIEAMSVHVSATFSEDSKITTLPPSHKSNDTGSAADKETQETAATESDQQPATKNLTLSHHLINRFIVVPEYKLALCSIDKVGSMMFQHLMLVLRLLHPSMTQKQIGSQTRRVWGGNTPKRFGMTQVEMTDVLLRTYKGEKWTTAVFYRDPVARFISAYKSKCGHADYDGADICRRTFGSRTAAFRDAVQTSREKLSTDVHFMTQTNMCGGLNADTLPHYTFVREFKKENTVSDVRELFAMSGVPNNVTEALITSVVKTGATNLDGDEELIHSHTRWTNLTFHQEAVLSAQHITSQTMQQENDFNDPELVQILVEKYKEDYDTFYHNRSWVKS